MIVVTLLRAKERINKIEHVSGRNIHTDTWKEKLMKSTGKKVKTIWELLKGSNIKVFGIYPPHSPATTKKKVTEQYLKDNN